MQPLSLSATLLSSMPTPLGFLPIFVFAGMPFVEYFGSRPSKEIFIHQHTKRSQAI